MARPLRITFEGALYHITSRGNRRRAIFIRKRDRLRFLDTLSCVVRRFQWVCYAYCLMRNHFHLLIETAQANLSESMRQLNSVYSGYFNRAHQRVGHVLQGRYHSVLVEKETHLLELCRYIVLNPVRAGLCSRPEDYPWSSYRVTMGMENWPGFVATARVISLFGEDPLLARAAYARFVVEGIGAKAPWDELKGGMFLGSDSFAEAAGKTHDRWDPEIPREQLDPVRPPLAALLSSPGGIEAAHWRYGYRLREIAAALGVHYATVSRRLEKSARHENASLNLRTTKTHGIPDGKLVLECKT